MCKKSLLSRRAALVPTAIAAILGMAGPVALAQTITVDIEDASIFDVPDTATVADLPGPDGHISFGEAMVASNNTPGRQTVAFAIPTNEWTHLPWYYPGIAMVFGWVPNMSANDEVTIDGTTQTAFTGDTNPNGWEVQFLTEFFVAADNCRITGLNSTAIWVDGSNCVIENNSAMSIHLYGGYGGSSSAGNLVRGNTGFGFLHIDQSSDNVVVGNTFRQLRLYGYVAGGFPAVNNRIGGPTLAERNYIIGTGTRNSEGFPGGFALQIVDATDTVVEHNQIGTSFDGLSIGHPNSIAGILIDGVNNNTTIRNNRIAGILAWAVPPPRAGIPNRSGDSHRWLRLGPRDRWQQDRVERPRSAGARQHHRDRDVALVEPERGSKCRDRRNRRGQWQRDRGTPGLGHQRGQHVLRGPHHGQLDPRQRRHRHRSRDALIRERRHA